MQLDKLREQLLEQHEALRNRISEVAALAARPRTGDEAKLLLEKVEQLVAALEEHNLFEETSLKGILGTLDSWGPQRENLMDLHHIQQHRLALTALAQTASHSSGLGQPDQGQPLQHLLHSLLEHMQQEEREVLHKNVLRDDVITADPFGG